MNTVQRTEPLNSGRLRLICLVAGVMLFASAAAAQAPDVARGRLLYENHCVVCHTQKVHRRIPAMPIDVRELRRIVASWARDEQLRWSQEEIEDVVLYLDRTHYQLGR